MATKKTKGQLTRCSGTMTEAQYLAWIRSALRSKWLKWKPRSQAIERARRPYVGQNKRQKWEVQCALCNDYFMLNDIEVDHYPHDAGSILSFEDIGPFVNRLYCEVDNLRVLCKPCHKCYTLSQSKGISLEEAKLEKKVTAALKDKKKVLAFLASYGYTGTSVSNESKRRALVTQIFKENEHEQETTSRR